MANPIHPLDGQTLPVRRTQVLGGIRVVIADHPEGGVIALPADAVTIEPLVPPSTREFSLPLFEPAQLMELAERVSALANRARSGMK